MDRKNYSTCRDCKVKPVEYRVSVDGKPVKHGVCRDCYERKVCRSVRGVSKFRQPRDPEMMENTRETKFGIDR
jgi:hypothetical protein